MTKFLYKDFFKNTRFLQYLPEFHTSPKPDRERNAREARMNASVLNLPNLSFQNLKITLDRSNYRANQYWVSEQKFNLPLFFIGSLLSTWLSKQTRQFLNHEYKHHRLPLWLYKWLKPTSRQKSWSEMLMLHNPVFCYQFSSGANVQTAKTWHPFHSYFVNTSLLYLH